MNGVGRNIGKTTGKQKAQGIAELKLAFFSSAYIIFHYIPRARGVTCSPRGSLCTPAPSKIKKRNGSIRAH